MSETINLTKGQNISLDKECPGLKKLQVGLGWDEKAGSSGADFDLDASAFLLDENGKAIGNQNEAFVFYNNLKSACESVTHTGDNLTGEGDGDDESIIIDLNKVPANCAKIAIVVTIHDAVARSQNFGQVANAFCRIVNADTQEEAVRYDLSEDYSVETGLVFAEIYRRENEWKVKAVGQGSAEGLKKMLSDYGMQ